MDGSDCTVSVKAQTWGTKMSTGNNSWSFYLIVYHRPCLHLVLKSVLRVDSRDPITQTTIEGGLGRIWPHSFSSVHAYVSWATLKHRPLNSRPRKPALSTTSEHFEKPIEIYYACVEHLGWFALPGTCQGTDPEGIALISFSSFNFWQTRHGKCILLLWHSLMHCCSRPLKTTTHLVFAKGNNVRVYLHIEREDACADLNSWNSPYVFISSWNICVFLASPCKTNLALVWRQTDVITVGGALWPSSGRDVGSKSQRKWSAGHLGDAW